MIETAVFEKRFATLHQWYRDNFTEIWLNSSAGKPLRVAYRCPWAAEYTLVIVSGRTEYIEKYLEVLRDLSNLNCSICVYDHCGQGGSGRLLDDPQKGHIDRFDTYILDLQRVIDYLRTEGSPNPVMLAGHSMGATIAALSALRYSGQISKLLLCSPMFAIHTGVMLPDFLVKALASLACRLGFGARYTPTTGPFIAAQNYDNNPLTSDRFRFEYNRFVAGRLAFAPLGGPTIGWLNESFTAMRRLHRLGGTIVQPVLALAAAGDQVIDVSAAARFVGNSENRTYREYPARGHELLMEQDEIRSDVLKQMNIFFNAA